MKALFVTGSDTGIGKTYMTALLVKTLRAKGTPIRAVKPLISGFDPAAAEMSDCGLLLAAMGEPVTPQTIAQVSPWRYAAALAPNMAARREGRTVDFDAVASWCKVQSGPLVIEGVGGTMSPITDDKTVLDWIVTMASPTLLVGGTYLGAISHTLTAIAAMRARGVRIAGIVVNESENSIGLADTADALRPFASALPIVPLARSGAPEQIRLDQMADLHAIALQCLAD